MTDKILVGRKRKGRKTRMPVFLCRWQNGDFSVVKAANKEDAIEFLDEVANAEDCSVTAIRDFMAHFRLRDDGEFELERFGEATHSDIMESSYGVLDKAFLNETNIQEAVAKERERFWPKDGTRKKSRNEPQTLLGRNLKAILDAPTTTIDRIVKKVATERLKKFKGKGKAN
jgi:hypothetical protein